MKIAIYVPSWPPGLVASGIVTYASQLVPALRRLGHEVFILTAHKSSDDNDPYTIDLQHFTSTPNFWQKAMFKLAPASASFTAASSSITAAICKLVDKYGLNVFEIEESFGWSYVISRLNILPVIVRLHGPWLLNGRFSDPNDSIALHRHRREWEGNGIRHAHLVTAPSAGVLQTVNNYYGLNPVRSRVIPNPLDAVVENKAWNIDTCDRDTLLFVGRFDKPKGGDLVLRTFANLANTYCNLTLAFVGPDSGVIGMDNKLWTFDEFVRSNIPEHCRSRIKFHGLVNHTDLMSLRIRSFCTIIASQHENMPYSVLEPMSFGCPLVATAVGGIPEMIKDRQNGLLVPSQNEKAMTDACKQLLADHTLAARLGRQAWQDCHDFYGAENIATQTVTAYQEAIDIYEFEKTR